MSRVASSSSYTLHISPLSNCRCRSHASIFFSSRTSACSAPSNTSRRNGRVSLFSPMSRKSYCINIPYVSFVEIPLNGRVGGTGGLQQQEFRQVCPKRLWPNQNSRHCKYKETHVDYFPRPLDTLCGEILCEGPRQLHARFSHGHGHWDVWLWLRIFAHQYYHLAKALP